MAKKDGNDTHQDDPAEVAKVATSGVKGGKGTSPKSKKERTYSQADVDKMFSDHKADVGREYAPIKTENETLKTRLGELGQSIEEMEAADRSRRHEAVKADPDALAAFNKSEELRKQAKKIATGEATLLTGQAALKTDREAFIKGMIPVIATKHGIEASALEGLGLTSQEAIEKVATAIAAGKPPETTPSGEVKEGEEEVEAGEAVVTSFEPVGVTPSKEGGGKLNTEDIEKGKTSMTDIASQVAPKPK